jgi:hypothetical protein
MKYLPFKSSLSRNWLTVAIGAATLILATSASVRADEDNLNGRRAPVVPANLVVPAGDEVAWHVHATGVQIYTWQNISATSVAQFAWVFKAPEAVLYDGEGDAVGIHYAGPTWENENGKVVGAVLQRANSPDANAIPWLLLQAVAHEGHGVLSRVTYIQRVNTEGGKAPATGLDASHAGEELRVPYSADYYFYRAKH